MVFGLLFFPELVRRFRCQFQLWFLSLPRWRLFPQIRGFYRYFGVFCYCLRTFRACDYLPWLRLWGGLFAPSVFPTLRPSPAVAGLVGFCCGPHHWLSLRVCVCVCRSFLGQQSCAFFLSSCSARGGLLLSLFLVLLLFLFLRRLRFSAVCPAAGYP